MKLIALTQGLSATVSDRDFAALVKHRWHAHRVKNTHYAARYEAGQRNKVFMHRQILGAPSETLIDHRDGNGLNNQRRNIRFCTSKQNASSFRTKKNKKSRFRGVFWRPETGKWRARIWPADARTGIHLGYFEIEEDAARAYDKKAKELYGKFAQLNFSN